jgi:hypothetical protein
MVSLSLGARRLGASNVNLWQERIHQLSPQATHATPQGSAKAVKDRNASTNRKRGESRQNIPLIYNL